MVETQPHGVGDVHSHVNPEYDSNEDGLIDGAETDINHSHLNDAPPNAHHNEPADVGGTVSAAAGSNTSTTVSFAQSYKVGVGSAGMQGISPLSGDASVVTYTTDANGNLDGMTIRYENTDTVSHTVEWRFVGVPA